jgi:hypothetical protein
MFLLILRFLQEPHGGTFQKTVFFIVIAVKASNLTRLSFLFVNSMSYSETSVNFNPPASHYTQNDSAFYIYSGLRQILQMS